MAVGDKVRWDSRGTELTVGVVEPLRALALSSQVGAFMWVWQFGLYPLDEQHTRFVTRGTERVPRTPLWWLGMRIMEPASFIMTRRFLLGVKERAEALRASASPTLAAPRTSPTAGDARLKSPAVSETGAKA